MFDPDDYELHEAQKHACKMAKERDRLRAELAECKRDAERYRTALEQIVAPFEDLNLVYGGT